MRQGVPLLEAIQSTSHLRARDAEPQSEKRQEGLAAPNASQLAQLAQWNEM